MPKNPEVQALHETVMSRGAKHLSDTDLLGVVLASPCLARVLARNIPKWWMLAQAELSSISRVSQNRVVQVLCLVELARRINSTPIVRGEAFRCSEQVVEAYGPRLAGHDQEVFLALSLDGRSRVIAEHEIARGTMNNVMVDPRLVFRKLLGDGAATAIVVHNHPSGDPSPSPDDVMVSERLAEAGRIIGVKLLDFIVVAGGNKSVSFAERGLFR